MKKFLLLMLLVLSVSFVSAQSLTKFKFISKDYYPLKATLLNNTDGDIEPFGCVTLVYADGSKEKNVKVYSSESYTLRPNEVSKVFFAVNKNSINFKKFPVKYIIEDWEYPILGHHNYKK